MNEQIISEIKRIIDDCEEYIESGVSRYSAESEKRNAYEQIVKLIKGEEEKRKN